RKHKAAAVARRSGLSRTRAVVHVKATAPRTRARTAAPMCSTPATRASRGRSAQLSTKPPMTHAAPIKTTGVRSCNHANPHGANRFVGMQDLTPNSDEREDVRVLSGDDEVALFGGEGADVRLGGVGQVASWDRLDKAYAK